MCGEAGSGRDNCACPDDVSTTLLCGEVWQFPATPQGKGFGPDLGSHWLPGSHWPVTSLGLMPPPPGKLAPGAWTQLASLVSGQIFQEPSYQGQGQSPNLLGCRKAPPGLLPGPVLPASAWSPWADPLAPHVPLVTEPWGFHSPRPIDPWRAP